MRRGYWLVALGAALVLSACTATSTTSGPTTTTTVAADAKQAMDDACYFAQSAEASFKLYTAKRPVDATAQSSFDTISATIDAACAAPPPADWRQVVSQLTVAGAQLAVMLVPAEGAPPASPTPAAPKSGS